MPSLNQLFHKWSLKTSSLEPDFCLLSVDLAVCLLDTLQKRPGYGKLTFEQSCLRKWQLHGLMVSSDLV